MRRVSPLDDNKAGERASAALKRAFKLHFAIHGYDAPLPRDLAGRRDAYPVEWSEACSEFEKYGFPD